MYWLVGWCIYGLLRHLERVYRSLKPQRSVLCFICCLLWKILNLSSDSKQNDAVENWIFLNFRYLFNIIVSTGKLFFWFKNSPNPKSIPDSTKFNFYWDALRWSERQHFDTSRAFTMVDVSCAFCQFLFLQTIIKIIKKQEAMENFVFPDD